MKQVFQKSLQVIESAFSELEVKVPKPQPVKMGDGFVFRYVDESIYQAIILKLARVASGLHATSLLLEHGYAQEQAVLQRVLDELDEDILFLVFAIWKNEVTDLHKRYLEAFFEEEFDDVDSPLKSSQKRPMIPRKKILAYLTQESGATVNQNDNTELRRTLSKAYSGFVHAAAPHIMDLYGGNPPKFHVAGMLGTQRVEESTLDLCNYYYRGLLTFIGVAKAFGDKNLVDGLYSQIGIFKKAYGVKYNMNIEKEGF